MLTLFLAYSNGKIYLHTCTFWFSRGPCWNTSHDQRLVKKPNLTPAPTMIDVSGYWYGCRLSDNKFMVRTLTLTLALLSQSWLSNRYKLYGHGRYVPKRPRAATFFMRFYESRKLTWTGKRFPHLDLAHSRNEKQASIYCSLQRPGKLDFLTNILITYMEFCGDRSFHIRNGERWSWSEILNPEVSKWLL